MDNKRKSKMFVKVKPTDNTLQSTQSKQRYTHTFFKYARILLLFGGMYPGEEPGEHPCASKLKKFFTAVIWMVYVGAIVVFCSALYIRIVESRDVTRLMSFSLMLLSSMYISCMYSFFLKKILPDVETLYSRYEELWYFEPGCIKWIKRTKSLARVLPVIYFITSPAMPILSREYPEIQCDVYPSCDFQEPCKTISFVTTAAAFILSNMQSQVIIIVFNILALFLQQEFRKNVRMFKDVVKSNPIGQESKFFTSVAHYETLVDIAHKTSDCVQHCTFLNVVMFLPLGCSFFYSFITREGTPVEVTFLCLGIFWSAFMVGLRLIMEALVSSKAGEPLQYVWNIKKEHFSEKGKHSLSLFVSRLTGDALSYRIYGLLNVNMPTLLGIVGTIVTYVIVVIQFRPPDILSQCEILLRNMTHCVTQ